MLKRLLICLWLLQGLVAQELPATRQPLPARPQIAAMGWPKFEAWCLQNLSEPGAAQLDRMALHYRDLRDESQRQSYPELNEAVRLLTEWVYARNRAAAELKGGSQYAHLGPRTEAQLADVKHECVEEWGSQPGPLPTGRWPMSYSAMADKPLTGGPKLATWLKQEELALQTASRAVRKLPGPVRHRLQTFMYEYAAQVDPNSRT